MPFFHQIDHTHKTQPKDFNVELVACQLKIIYFNP